MSTSRKLRLKLAKQAFSKESHLHRSCPKRTRARTRREFHLRDTGLHREGNSHCPICAHRYSVCLLLPLAVGPKIICRTHLHISARLGSCTFQSRRRAHLAHRGRRRLESLRAARLGHRNIPREPPQQVSSVKSLAVCLSHSPSEIWQNIHFVFYPTVSGPRKRKHQATATNPDRETTSLSDSDTSSTVDTSTSEGEDEKDFILPDYPSDELTSPELSEFEPEEAPAKNLSTGWSERVTRVDTQFHGDHVGSQNIPDHNNHESTALSFLKLFINADFWGFLCRQTNLRAEQVKQSKPDSYYAKNFKPVAVPELKAFLCLRLQKEKCVIKPQYESYWQEAGHNFIAHTPGFREVMERDRFIALWGFALGRSDGRGRGQVRQDLQSQAHARQNAPSLSPLLQPPPATQLRREPDSHQEPPRHQAVHTRKPVRCFIKSFLLCEAKMGYILDAEIYTGRVRNRHWPLRGSAGSVVRRLVENSQVSNKNHMLFMDRFYNSVALFHLLKKELGVLAAGTSCQAASTTPRNWAGG